MPKEEKAKQPQSITSEKYIFGTVKMGEKGQICIPKAARELFGLTAGSSLLVVGDSLTGIALITDQALSQMLGQASMGHAFPISTKKPEANIEEKD